VSCVQCISTAGEPYLAALAKAEAEGIALPNTLEHLKTQASLFLLAAGEEKKPAPSFWDPPAPTPTPAPEFRLPSKYLPAFWPLFFVGVIATLHALVVLLQVWIVDFKCWVRFRRVTSVAKATHLKVSPAHWPVAETCGGG
jgi:hypothetical protein